MNEVCFTCTASHHRSTLTASSVATPAQWLCSAVIYAHFVGASHPSVQELEKVRDTKNLVPERALWYASLETRKHYNHPVLELYQYGTRRNDGRNICVVLTPSRSLSTLGTVLSTNDGGETLVDRFTTRTSGPTIAFVIARCPCFGSCSTKCSSWTSRARDYCPTSSGGIGRSGRCHCRNVQRGPVQERDTSRLFKLSKCVVLSRPSASHDWCCEPRRVDMVHVGTESSI